MTATVLRDRSADPYRASLALGATGLLATFNEASILDPADVHVATTVKRLYGESDERVLLAAALAVRAVRSGSVCIDLGSQRGTVTTEDENADFDALPWPPPAEWHAACVRSPAVTLGVQGPSARPLRLVGRLLYLERYWRQEDSVRMELARRARAAPPAVGAERLRAALARVFPPPSARSTRSEKSPDERQMLAVAAAATGWVTVIAGGPGTGKTTTVARLLALLCEVSDTEPRIALAAPTGKAAVRLSQAVSESSEWMRGRGLPVPPQVEARTVHRLLGSRPGVRSRFRHDRDNRLPYDVVVVDETSMVSLTLMSRLLDAVRDDARVVLVGDPDQLASVEAGAVLADLVERPGRPVPDARLDAVAGALPGLVDSVAGPDLRRDVVHLTTRHRYGAVIGALADAVQGGDADLALRVLRNPETVPVPRPPRGDEGVSHVEFIEIDPAAGWSGELEGLRADVVAAGTALFAAAAGGRDGESLAVLDRHRLLCAHRRGPYGVTHWERQLDRWLRDAGLPVGGDEEWYPGRSLLMTANDYDTGLFNGDTGVVVREAGGTGSRLVAAFGRGSDVVRVPPNRLADVLGAHAMTVHRSQGSQVDTVTVILPPPESRLATRELIYTAVTRAKTHVRVIGTEAALRAAIDRRVVRASGLRESPEGVPSHPR